MPVYFTRDWWPTEWWPSGWWPAEWWPLESVDDTATASCVLGTWLITSDVSGDFSITSTTDGSWETC